MRNAPEVIITTHNPFHRGDAIRINGEDYRAIPMEMNLRPAYVHVAIRGHEIERVFCPRRHRPGLPVWLIHMAEALIYQQVCK